MNNFSYFVEKINLYKKQIVQLVKFSIVGVINTAVDFAVFFLFILSFVSVTHSVRFLDTQAA